MAVLASLDGISVPHLTFYDLRFHSLPPFDAPLVLQPSTWLLSPLPSMDTHANCLFDPLSPVSTVSPSFSLQLNIQCRNVGILIAINTTTDVFSCLVELQL